MIRAIITDVDGVIVGDKTGINFPLPNEKVIRRLKEVSKSGIPIILCTGKFNYAIEGIIRQAELDNPHIADGGSLIYNPLKNQIIKEHVITKELATAIVKTCLANNIYLEVFSAKDYHVQKDQVYELTAIRTSALQKEPKLVDSLIDIIQTMDTIKILAFAKNNSERPNIETILSPFNDRLNAMWSTLPIMLPAMARVITAKGVSKMHAAQEVLEYLGISFAECLGVGDLPADWKFMQLCKYVAGIGDLDEEFRQNILSKGKGNYFLASSANEDGFLDILQYFLQK